MLYTTSDMFILKGMKQQLYSVGIAVFVWRIYLLLTTSLVMMNVILLWKKTVDHSYQFLEIDTNIQPVWNEQLDFHGIKGWPTNGLKII